MKKKALGPRVKRMKRSARLQCARSWVKSYKGKDIARGYWEHFGVDPICAFKELEMLGVKIDAEYKNTTLKSVTAAIEARSFRKLKRKGAVDELFDSDDTFAYIAGYTEGGFAYGVTWEEWEEAKNSEALNSIRDSTEASLAVDPWEDCEDDEDRDEREQADLLNPEIDPDITSDDDMGQIPF